MVRGEIIENPKVLTPEYLPERMPHRNNERTEIARALEPLMDENGYPMDTLIYGPPGVGKSAMAEFVLNKLKEEIFLQDMHVNCFSHKTRFDILYQLLDKKVSVPRAGTSTQKVRQLLDEKVKSKPSVIVVDEVDQIKNGEILFDLARYTETALIMIANDPEVFGYFDDRVRSRLTSVQKVKFSNYTKDEMFDILNDRARSGLYQNTISEDQLSEIASYASGDARKGLNTLRKAARNAENNSQNKITDQNIEQALDEADEERQLKSLELLNKHQKTMYTIIREADQPISISEIENRYTEETPEKDTRTRRTLRRYLNKMEAYNLIKAQGRKSGRKYQI